MLMQIEDTQQNQSGWLFGRGGKHPLLSVPEWQPDQ